MTCKNCTERIVKDSFGEYVHIGNRYGCLGKTTVATPRTEKEAKDGEE